MNKSRQTTFSALTSESRKLSDIDWTFERADTTYLTHGIHAYPARMIPQIPDALLSHYIAKNVIEEGDAVYDPFCGSGTTAVEATQHGLNCVTHDINPFACYIAKAKTTVIPRDVLTKSVSQFITGEHTDREPLNDRLEKIAAAYDCSEDSVSDSVTVDAPNDIRDGWFPEPQLQQLWHIQESISALRVTDDVKRVLRIALAKTSRTVSYQRNNEYKRYRIPKAKRDTHNPDVFSLYHDNIKEITSAITQYGEHTNSDNNVTIKCVDSRNAIANTNTPVTQNSMDITITSPPYGDHSTTVAYGQYSQDPAIITGEFNYDEMKAVDKNGLGGENTKTKRTELESRSSSLRKTLTTLSENDGRDNDAIEFMSDYFDVICETGNITKPNQPVIWVVANRTMSRVQIPTHKITRELCESVGYNHNETLPRDIPTKTLPWKNAPENEAENTGELMAEENIVVMDAPETVTA